MNEEDLENIMQENLRLGEENDLLRTALLMLKKSIEQDPAMSTQMDNWMLGIIETALGDTSAR